VNLLRLSLKSFWSRRLVGVLIILSLGLSLFVYLAIERSKDSAEASFRRGISGTDLIVGARTGPTQLLLYTVFGLGQPTNNMSTQSYKHFSQHPEVSWAVPISLGDSHSGYRVIGTKSDLFEHFRYGRGQPIEFAQGHGFEGLLDVVIGSEVAARLDYRLGDTIILQHGLGGQSFYEHDDHHFRIVGILAGTSTVLDESLFIDLLGMELIHLGWDDGAPPVESQLSYNEEDLTVSEITAMFVGLKNRFQILDMQREINRYEGEPLTAIMPGAVFQQLWQVVSFVERILNILLFIVLALCFVTLFNLLWVALDLRKREIAIYRALGASPQFIFLLFLVEGGLISLGGIVVGLAVFYGLSPVWQPVAEEQFGVIIELGVLSQNELLTLLSFFLVGVFASLIPGIRAYRASLIGNILERSY